MSCDFDKVIDRKNTNSIKWDFAAERGMPEGLISMWVADMDFTAPREVLDDIHRAVEHGIFGYSEVKQDYYDVLAEWFENHYGLKFGRQDVIKTPGVVFGLAACVRALTKPQDAVIIQTPVYYPFYNIIQDNNRKLVTNPLKYENGKYSIDFDDFEKKVKENSVKLFILCSPHNPVSRVWSKDELEHINKICVKYGVIIVSDEIHCDFVYAPYEHTSCGLINVDAIIATSPSKTFNLAGLQAANFIVRNVKYRQLIREEISRTGYSQLNTLGLVACQSAYTHGKKWLERLKEYLTGNIGITRKFISERLPRIHLVEPQGTYLLWLDFSAYGFSQEKLDRLIVQEAGLWLDTGTMFGKEGEGFQRINIACPRTTLETALERLDMVFGRIN